MNLAIGRHREHLTFIYDLCPTNRVGRKIIKKLSGTSCPLSLSSRGHKGCRLSWLTTRALVLDMSPDAGGGVAGFQPISTAGVPK